jgi:hypothetical protein
MSNKPTDGLDWLDLEEWRERKRKEEEEKRKKLVAKGGHIHKF